MLDGHLAVYSDCEPFMHIAKLGDAIACPEWIAAHS